MGALRWLYERAYRRGATPWDTGIPPPELVEVVEGEAAIEPGRALDMGCGTGTNVLYLAQRGWTAVGVDFSSHAIESARRKADWVSGASFVEGDVTELAALGVVGPFDLVLDVGCFHGIVPARRAAYVREVARVARAGARLLMFAFGGRMPFRRGLAVREAEIRRRFGATFELERTRPGTHPPGAAWYYLRREGSAVGRGERGAEA